MDPTVAGEPVPASPGRSRMVDVDEAWSQPLGPLDLLELVLDGLVLLPDFSPTVVQYEASLDRASSASEVSPAVGFELSVAPARRATPVLVASPTGRVTDLGQGRYRFDGDTGCDHHLTVTVGHPQGPSRTTVIALRAATAHDDGAPYAGACS